MTSDSTNRRTAEESQKKESTEASQDIKRFEESRSEALQDIKKHPLYNVAPKPLELRRTAAKWDDIFNGNILRLRRHKEHGTYILIDKFSGMVILSVKDERIVKRLMADMRRLLYVWGHYEAKRFMESQKKRFEESQKKR